MLRSILQGGHAVQYLHTVPVRELQRFRPPVLGGIARCFQPNSPRESGLDIDQGADYLAAGIDGRTLRSRHSSNGTVIAVAIIFSFVYLGLALRRLCCDDAAVAGRNGTDGHMKLLGILNQWAASLTPFRA